MASMRAVAVCGPAFDGVVGPVATLELEGNRLRVALVRAPEPDVDLETPGLRDHVLVRVRAFSLNYRDRAILLAAHLSCPPDAFLAIGSEMAGVVVRSGPEARGFAPGDRVMTDASYPFPSARNAPRGIPSNRASLEYAVFHEAKLARIPDEMPDEVAACFTVCAQTAYSMVRRLDVRPGAGPVLVTAGRSSTALFTVAALAAQGIESWVLTSSTSFEDRLRANGAARVLHLPRAMQDLREHPELGRILKTGVGRFRWIVDPFYDVYLQRVCVLLAPEGRYVTCGLEDQTAHVVGRPPRQPDGGWDGLFGRLLLMNLHILGNCLGTSADLRRALTDYVAGRLRVALDSVHGEDALAAFVDRTWTAPDRLGKVALRYT